VADLVSTEFAIVSGGLACIAGAIALASLLPGFRHNRASPGPGASRWRRTPERPRSSVLPVGEHAGYPSVTGVEPAS